MILVVVFAVVACVRIGLTSATVSTAIASENTAAQVESARSTGNDLEVQESYLTNPTYVKNIASTQLGMAAPAETTTISLADDVVATDAQGNLSLADSLAVAAQG